MEKTISSVIQKNIIIKSVELKDAVDYSNNAYNDKKYGRNSITSRTTMTKCLLVNFVEKGSDIEGYFFTPSFEIVKVDGFLCHTYMPKSSPWMKEIKGETVGHKNVLHYEGSFEPSVVIESKTEIVPVIRTGDEIKIKAKVKKITPTGKIHLNFVKIV